MDCKRQGLELISTQDNSWKVKADSETCKTLGVNWQSVQTTVGALPTMECRSLKSAMPTTDDCCLPNSNSLTTSCDPDSCFWRSGNKCDESEVVKTNCSNIISNANKFISLGELSETKSFRNKYKKQGILSKITNKLTNKLTKSIIDPNKPFIKGMKYNATPLLTAQFNWFWCKNCSAYAYSSNINSCPGKTGFHDFSESAIYNLSVTSLNNYNIVFKYCDKCGCLVSRDDASCAAGGTHSIKGSYYLLESSNNLPTGFQDGWHECSQCAVLYFGDVNGGGICPSIIGKYTFYSNGKYLSCNSSGTLSMSSTLNDGCYWDTRGGHIHSIYGTYISGDPSNGKLSLSVNSGSWETWKFVQIDTVNDEMFKWCKKCGQLCSLSRSNWNCSKGGLHDVSDSVEYITATTGIVDNDWKVCDRCSTLVYTFSGPSVCYDGQPHNLVSDKTFSLYMSSTNNTQGNWRACGKCSSLYFDYTQCCPANNKGNHTKTNQEYFLTITNGNTWAIQSQHGGDMNEQYISTSLNMSNDITKWSIRQTNMKGSHYSSDKKNYIMPMSSSTTFPDNILTSGYIKSLSNKIVSAFSFDNQTIINNSNIYTYYIDMGGLVSDESVISWINPNITKTCSDKCNLNTPASWCSDQVEKSCEGDNISDVRCSSWCEKHKSGWCKEKLDAYCKSDNNSSGQGNLNTDLCKDYCLDRPQGSTVYGLAQQNCSVEYDKWCNLPENQNNKEISSGICGCFDKKGIQEYKDIIAKTYPNVAINFVPKCQYPKCAGNTISSGISRLSENCANQCIQNVVIVNQDGSIGKIDINQKQECNFMLQKDGFPCNSNEDCQNKSCIPDINNGGNKICLLPTNYPDGHECNFDSDCENKSCISDNSNNKICKVPEVLFDDGHSCVNDSECKNKSCISINNDSNNDSNNNKICKIPDIKPECVTNSDCNGGEYCSNSKCIPSPPVCLTDKDCGDGKECVVVNGINKCIDKEGKVVDNSTCTIDKDCGIGGKCVGEDGNKKCNRNGLYIGIGLIGLVIIIMILIKKKKVK